MLETETIEKKIHINMQEDDFLNKNSKPSFSLLLFLPEDPSQMVLSYLNLHCMLQLSLTSTYLRKMVSSSHSLFLPDSQDALELSLSNQGFNFMNKSANGSSITFSPGYNEFYKTHIGSPSSTRLPARTTMSLQQISSLTSLQQISSLLKRFQNLRHLTLHKLNLVEDKFLSLFRKYPSTPQLITLQLYHVRILPHQELKRENDTTPHPINLLNLQHLSIKGSIYYSGIASLLTSASSRIKSMQLEGFRTASDACLTKFLSPPSIHKHDKRIRMSIMTELQLKDFTQIQLPRISFSSLLRLDLSQSGIQSLNEILCPQLIELDLSSCCKLTDNAIHSYLSGNTAFRLEILNLKACQNLRNLQIHSKSIKYLNMSLCTSLKLMEVDCENLLHLEVGNCHSLQSFILHPSKYLETLDFSLLSRLQRISLLHTPSLYSLDLSGCMLLSDVQLINNDKLAYVNICGTGISMSSKVNLRGQYNESSNDSNQTKETALSCDLWGRDCLVVDEVDRP